MIYRFNATPIKIPVSYFVDVDKLILRFLGRGKVSRVANTIVKEKNKVGGLILLEFKTYYKATVTKTVCNVGKRRDK